jgi:hypothetical protein
MMAASALNHTAQGFSSPRKHPDLAKKVHAGDSALVFGCTDYEHRSTS